jgi:hypothetical protein
MVGLGLVLASAGSQVKATSPSNHIASIPPPLKKAPDQYTSYHSYITIAPPAPTPDDVIRITVSGKWFNVCVPRYQSHQVNDNMIRIEAKATIFGFCVPIEGPTDWSFTVEVGPLPIGLYTIEFYIFDPLIGLILYDNSTFMVATERLYLPIILREP